jgi:hypothetical protein
LPPTITSLEKGDKKMSAWTDILNKGFDSLGIDRQTRDAGGEILSTLNSQFGGNVPNPVVQTANQSLPQVTDPKAGFWAAITKPKVGPVPVWAIVGGVLVLLTFGGTKAIHDIFSGKR